MPESYSKSHTLEAKCMIMHDRAGSVCFSTNGINSESTPDHVVLQNAISAPASQSWQAALLPQGV
jgi:hypothetical protein